MEKRVLATSSEYKISCVYPSSQDYSHLASAPETVNGKVVHWTIGALLYRTRFLPLR